MGRQTRPQPGVFGDACPWGFRGGVGLSGFRELPGAFQAALRVACAGAAVAFVLVQLELWLLLNSDGRANAGVGGDGRKGAPVAPPTKVDWTWGARASREGRFGREGELGALPGLPVSRIRGPDPAHPTCPGPV